MSREALAVLVLAEATGRHKGRAPRRSAIPTSAAAPISRRASIVQRTCCLMADLARARAGVASSPAPVCHRQTLSNH
jgi:hypothetical protein